MSDLEDDPNLGGTCSKLYVEHSALIRIHKKDFTLKMYDNKTEIITAKSPQELTLIHELLHCKFVTFENSTKGLESAIVEHCQHDLLEQIAKSLFMTKYNLNFEWFKVKEDK